MKTLEELVEHFDNNPHIDARIDDVYVAYLISSYKRTRNKLATARHIDLSIRSVQRLLAKGFSRLNINDPGRPS